MIPGVLGLIGFACIAFGGVAVIGWLSLTGVFERPIKHRASFQKPTDRD